MTGVASMAGVIQELAVQAAGFLSLLLLASALHKLLGRDRALAAVHEFGGVPRHFAPFALALVAAGELAAGLLLWSPAHRAAAGGFAALIFGGYLALIVNAMARGRGGLDCGCTFGAARHPLSAYHIGRNAALTGGCLLVTVACAAFDSDPFTAPQMLAALALLALYGALDEALVLTAPRSGELL